MVSKTKRYIDEFGNKIILEREDDEDFQLEIKYNDGTTESFLITKQDFKKMKYLDAILGENE